MAADFIPDNQFVPDKASSTQGSAAPDFVSDEQFTADEDKYNNPMDIIASVGQGALNTATMGLAPKLMEQVGFDPKIMREFKEANPIAYSVGQVGGLLSTPAGEAIGAAGAGAKALVGEGILGSAAKLATETALLQTTDEVAKAMLHDPNQTMQTAAINIGMSGLLGGAFGTAGGVLGKGMSKLADSGVGEFLSDFRGRLGEHVAPESTPTYKFNPEFRKPFQEAPMFTEEGSVPKPEMVFKDLTPGQKAADYFMQSKLSGQGLGGAIGGAMGHSTGIPYMGYLGAGMGAKTLGPALDAVIKPLVRGVISGEAFAATSRLVDAMVKGEAAMSNAAKAVFDSSLDVIPTKLMPTKEDREHLQDTLKTSQDAPESILNAGGQLEPYLPSHNVALGQLAGQTLAFLGSQSPKPGGGKLPLDSVIPPSKQDQAMFNRTLDIAQQPLMIMKHIKDGTLLSHDLSAFQAMYPALRQRFSQALISKLIDHKSTGKSIPYKTRVGLSLFTAQPLDSTMTPQALQAIQAQYAQKQSQPAPAPQKAKQGTKSLSKVSSQYQTAEQSREARRNK